MVCTSIESATACVDWTEYENDALDIELGWGDENSETSGIYYDLTSYTARFQVKDIDGVLKINLTEASGITLSDGTNFPNILIEVDKALHVAMGAGRYTYGFELTPANGKTNTLMEGKYKLTNSVPG